MTDDKAIKNLVEEVKKLAANPLISNTVDQRIQEFLQMKSEDSRCWFKELVYCVLTAYSSAESGLKCLKLLEKNDKVFDGSEDVLEECLRAGGHRFASKRAGYISLAQAWRGGIKEKIMQIKDVKAAREWLVDNIKGIGWKEASHFLRNVGFLDLAIIDRHILKVMAEYGVIKKGKRSMTKNRYLHYEVLLKKVADELKMPPGKLDFYLWYLDTKTLYITEDEVVK